MKRFHIMGDCHVDLAWHCDAEQYEDYLEQFTVILLDMLEQFPDMTYMIEQAWHYRELEKRRPDLVERVKKFIAQGRIEVVGALISTADTNIPCAEALVRNQLLGKRWFAEHMHAQVKTAWLTDTFGCHAQVPQFLNDFGLHQMIATRFGGNLEHEVFWAQGLDGTKTLVCGRDCFTHNQPAPEHSRIFFDFAIGGERTDAEFEHVRRTTVDGPIMVNVSIEDEVYPTRRAVKQAYRLMQDTAQSGDESFFSNPSQFFDELRTMQTEFPVQFADLNPEFTGTYSNRVKIKLQNRRTETALLDAEKWLTLMRKPYGKAFEEAWWQLSFVQFHDVFSGSTPSKQFLNVLDRLKTIRNMASQSMSTIFGQELGMAKPCNVRVVNGLPFARREWVHIPCDQPMSVADTPSFFDGQNLWFQAETKACSSRIYTLQSGCELQAAEPACVESTTLENEYLRLVLDSKEGITLKDKVTGTEMLHKRRDLLVLQGDVGNFQFERIVSTECYAWSSPVRIERMHEYAAKVSGEFQQPDGTVDAIWEITFSLLPSHPVVKLGIHANWKARGKRMRLKVCSTLLNAGAGVYEVPFGVVRRGAYAEGETQKGEWPAQRFVAIEDAQSGLALINDGVPGVEILSGTIYSTLLRSPVEEYAGMIPDDTSSQHGIHDFGFAILCYPGHWQASDVIRQAQAFNNPLRIFAADDMACDGESLLSIENPAIVLTAVKQAEDHPEDIVVRVYESIGVQQNCTLHLPGTTAAWVCTMEEKKREALEVVDDTILLHAEPWQIVSIYVQKEKK